jgi:HprK-related kinase B
LAPKGKGERLLKIKLKDKIMTVELYKEKLMQGQQLCDQLLVLNLEGCVIKLQSNSPDLIKKMTAYFEDCNVINTASDVPVNINMLAIESTPIDLGIDFVDWAREPGKTGRKDEYFEIEKGRLVRKVRTGMVFLQSEETVMAAGPCIEYDNQLTNFINSQYMNWLQNRDWLICHASGMRIAIDAENSQGFAIAGLSGGGKSTLMLELMNNEKVSYVTNDRLFAKNQKLKGDGDTLMLGIPKLPRINPGTIVGNPKLHSLLSKQQLDKFQAMETSELWPIEEKYDVPIKQIYGAQRLNYSASLKTFIILNWERGSDKETCLELVDIEKNTGLLKAIMKSPGPFYQFTDGHFQDDNDEFNQQSYIDNLSEVKIYEATGNIDFVKMSELILSTFN